jgi:hypothetical protein
MVVIHDHHTFNTAFPKSPQKIRARANPPYLLWGVYKNSINKVKIKKLMIRFKDWSHKAEITPSAI